jgi:hypothetical protein
LYEELVKAPFAHYAFNARGVGKWSIELFVEYPDLFFAGIGQEVSEDMFGNVVVVLGCIVLFGHAAFIAEGRLPGKASNTNLWIMEMGIETQR